ncbi:MAG: hypothetical protein OXT65_09835 [Alphaproteobacteria bacterium]|nr:hypothetical protein [Alphaproteobacteria bacterium]
MSAKNIDVITEYEVLFAVRTGLTILIPKSPVFDGGIETAVACAISHDNPRDLCLSGCGKHAVIKGLSKDYLDEATARGFIMFYEMEDEEVVRCTPCAVQTGQGPPC